MEKSNHFSRVWQRLVSVFLVFALFIGIFPARIIHAEDPEEDLFISESSEEMAEDYAVWPYDTLPEENDHLDENANITEENLLNREEAIKDFRLDNGMNVAVSYPYSVHYKENEEWKEIDNTLKSIENDKGVFYHDQAGMWDVYLPQVLSKDHSVIVSKKGNTLSFSFEGELYDDDEITNINETTGQIEEKEYPEEYDEPDMQVLKKIVSTVNYPNVYEDTDLRYDLISNCLKETVILKSYKEGLVGYRYKLDSEDLVLQLQEDKTILAYKKDELDGDPVFWLPAPYMYDNKGVFSHDVEVTLTKEENGYLLSYGLPEDWLSDNERLYPVRLDPIVQPTASYLTINDVDVPENHFTEYLDTILGIGYNARYTNGHRERVLMRFNSIPELSSADIVVKGEIILYNTLVQYAMPIEAHEVYENWQSNTVTWSTLPSFNELVEDYQNVNTGNTTYTWDITNIAQHWYSNNLNTGVLFKAPDSVENAQIERYSQFYSSEYDYGHVTLMRLYYVNNCGLEGIWGYTSHSAGRAGTGYINDYTGNLVWINEGLSFPGNRMPVSINHVYNANDKDNNSFGLGYGWRTNFNQLVYQWSQDSSYYVWEDEDGTRHYFAYKSANTYEDESGNGLILTNNGSGTTKYCIKDKKDNKSYFDTQGRLTKISDDQATVSSIQITYVSDTSRHISQIKDGTNRKYQFVYTNNLISAINYLGTGNNTLSYRTFSHTGDNLTSIGYPDNENVSFTYTDTSHLLKNATGPGGYRINYTYSSSSPKRVIKVREYGNDTLGGTLNIEYSHNQTTFTDHNGNQIIKQFNHWGSTVSVQDGLGRGEFFDYKNKSSNITDNLNIGSTLAVSSKLQDTVINLVKNGSFEANGYWVTPSSNQSTGSWGYTSDQHYYGQKSLYITRTENDTAFRVSPTSGNRFTLEEGKTYTVSAYVKTTGMDGTGSGARITITEDGHTVPLAQSSPVTVTSSWVRLEATYTRPSGSGDINGNIYLENFSEGNAYFDAVQFEEAPFASRYNMVENADFRMKGDTESDSYKWAKSSDCGTSDKRVSLSAGSANHLLDSHAFKVIGETNKNKRYYQTINQSGESGDVYTLAGWAKGDSVPLHDDRRFALLCQFQNTDGTTTDRYVSFNPDKDSNNSWQYAADRVLANKDYSSIKVMVVYDHNQNTVYFDGIQLYKEQFGHSYVYDEDNNLISVSDLKNKKTQYEYTDNELTKITLPTGPIEEYTYDSHHNVLTATDQDGIEMSFVYDQYGNNTKLTVQKNSVKSVVTATYTSDGNYLSSVTDSLGNTTYYDHDTQTGVLNWVQEPGQTSSNRLTYTYDNMYRTTDLTMGSYTAEFSYTSQGKLDEIGSPSGTVYDFTYSTNFNMPKQVKIGNRELIFNNYNNSQDRLLTKTTYANGDYVQYSYDDWYRPIKMTYEDSETVDFIYGTDGALGRMYDSESGRTTKYMYDFQGLVKRIDETGDNYSNSVRYTYDSTNVLTTMKQIVNGASFTTSYEYDDDDRTSKISRSTMSETFLYDSLGRLSNNEVKNSNVLAAKTIITYKDGVGESDTTGKVDTWKVRRYNAGSQSGGVDYSYNYNEKGNISSVTRGSYTTDYVYDVKGQLTRVNDQYADKTWVYTYYKGNLKTRKEYAYTTGDPVNEISSVTYTYGDSTWKDLLTKYGNTNYTYDPSGNLTNNGEWSFTWKHGSELDSMTNGTDTVSFLYDAEGKRISKSDGTNTFEYFYADGKLTRIKRNNTTLHFDYDMLGPSVIRYNGVDYYYHRNAQGDIDGISNAAGELVASYRYDAWGKPLSITGTMASTIGVLNPFRYRGYVYDEETGLYYLNSRYYDPEVGRFISPDSVSYLGADGTILGYDLYTYCDNDPVNHRDSEGNLWNFVIGGLVGGIVGGISAAVSSYKTTGSVSLASVAIGAASGIIGGLIGASGLDPIKQAVTSGLLSFGTNVSNQLVNNGNDWGEVKWGDALIDGAITAVCSWIGGKITAKAKNEAEALIDKGSKRFVQGVKKMVYGKKNFVKVMKQGIDWLQTGDKNRNIAQGTASVIGSITNGIISLGKSIFGSGK